MRHARFGTDYPPGAGRGMREHPEVSNSAMCPASLEQVTGEPCPDVLRAKILEPLGLDETSFPDTSKVPEPHPQGFSLQGTPDDSPEPIVATDWSPTFAWTAGQIISSIDDMLDWGRILATGQGILDEEMSVERLDSFPGASGYGYAAGCINAWVGHTGEIPGFNASLFHDAANDPTVVVLTNSDIPLG